MGSFRDALILVFTIACALLSPAVTACPEMQVTEDPIELSINIINAHPEHWAKGADKGIVNSFRLNEEIKDRELIYRLLESPGLTIDFLAEEEGKIAGYLSKESFIKLLGNAATSPESTSRKIARATLGRSLEEYKRAFEIAGQYQITREISLEDAIAFLDNRYGYAKLEDARDLFQVGLVSREATLDNKKIRDKLRSIEKSYPDNISLENALKEVYDFYGLMVTENVGLAAYKPYTRFREVMEQLNKSRIANRRKYRATIAISNPAQSTVWQLNEPVSVQWSTENIQEDKSLRFFLVKGEMVVQELGTFENIGSASGIRLNKNIDSGDDYRVVGIELFPANKYYNAKVATPNLSIRRPPRPTKAPVAKSERVPVISEPGELVSDSAGLARSVFEGRKISYVKELTVDSADIGISIWDHGRQDQDIVSIYLNGQPVVAEHSLTYRKKHFDIHLDAAQKNDLFLYAHNLGFYPPNTVSIEVIDNSNSENIVLNSDLKSCEAVLINVRP
jgi:hypothetical protein